MDKDIDKGRELPEGYYEANKDDYTGIQYSTMITSEDNSADINRKQSSVLLENDDVVIYQLELFKVKVKGCYSDAVDFIKLED